MPLDDHSESLTAFVTPLGLSKCKKISMGLAPAKAAFLLWT